MSGTPIIAYTKEPIDEKLFRKVSTRMGASVLPDRFSSNGLKVRIEAIGRSGSIRMLDATLMSQAGREILLNDPLDDEDQCVVRLLGGLPKGEVMFEIDSDLDITHLDLRARDFFIALADELGEDNRMVVLGTEGFQRLWTVPELRALRARGGRLAPWLEAADHGRTS